MLYISNTVYFTFKKKIKMARKKHYYSGSLGIHVQKEALGLAKIQPICPNHQFQNSHFMKRL